MLTTLTSRGSSVARPRKPAIELPPHVNAVRVKGRPYYYFHPGRGTKGAAKPIRLPDDPRQPEFWDAYRKARGEPEPRPNANAVETLIDAYTAAPEWRQLSDNTRTNWLLYLERIKSKWGPLEVRGIEPRHVLALRDKYADTPAAANNLLRCLSSMLSWSVPRGWRANNPCLLVPKLKSGDGYKPWPWDMIELVEKHAPRWMWHAVALALYTGQRQDDVLAMTRGKIKNGLIEVRQEKTGCALAIPAHQRLLPVIGAMRGELGAAPHQHARPAVDQMRLQSELEESSQGAARRDPRGGTRLPRFAQVRRRDAARGRLHRRRSCIDHGSVTPDDRALLAAGEPEEARSRRNLEVGESSVTHG